MARIRGYMCLAAVMSAVFLANCVNSRSLNERTLNEIPTRIFSKKYDAGYDLSCRGSFDGELFKDLDEVCQNCFYLIYDTGVTAKCRAKCFDNNVYSQCLEELMYPVDLYLRKAQRLYSG